MGLIDAVKRALGRSAEEPAGAGTTETPQSANRAAEQELHVPEVTATQLMAELESDAGQPLLLDCREYYERAQGFIPNSLHIPMNNIPARLAELKSHRDIVVYCAHGNRSYGVAGWLILQGFAARSLKGGIEDWRRRHGPVEGGYRASS